MRVANREKIYKDSFGHWLSGLFGAIGGNNPGLPFDERRRAFFELIGLWLREGKIAFCDPAEPLNSVWRAEPDDIIRYLELHWPEDAKGEDDPSLNVYFYEMPAVLWIGENGRFYGS